MAPIKILASQAHSVNLYKNLRTQVMMCRANIYFNRQSINTKVIPKYANVKLSRTPPAANVSLNKIQKIRIKDELKSLYKPSLYIKQ
jgi:hypothetical protein